MSGPAAQAQAWPSKPIRLIVPYAAGGPTDVIARLVAKKVGGDLGQTIIVDNKGGAGGTIGVDATLKSAPDGYTFALVAQGPLAGMPNLMKLPYALNDGPYVTLVARIPAVIVAGKASGINSLPELLKQAKARPGSINYSSAGPGTTPHIGAELLKQEAGIDITHVPYKGAAPAMTDVMGGQVPTMMLDLASGLPIIKAGKVRVLAIALPQRAGALPDVPTFKESGFNDVNAYAFHGLIGPAGMPPDAVARVNGELHKAMKAPKVAKLFAEFGFEALPGTPQEFYTLARAESERWGKIIQAAGVKLD
jgi:tripartite-type tricarboxylate transporter receptor subunit TctC